MINLRLFSLQSPNDFQDLSLRPETMPDRKCTIGRSPTATVILDSQEVSRLHREIVERNGDHYFIDTDSSGGSSLNDVAVGLRELLRQQAEGVEGTPVAIPVVIPTTAPVASGSKIAVMFKKSDQQVSCDGEESILDVAEQNGVKIRSSCRSGNCGTCKKKKVSGSVKMGDFDSEALEPSEQEEGYILTCVAFPQDLVTMDA